MNWGRESFYSCASLMEAPHYLELPCSQGVACYSQNNSGWSFKKPMRSIKSCTSRKLNSFYVISQNSMFTLFLWNLFKKNILILFFVVVFLPDDKGPLPPGLVFYCEEPGVCDHLVLLYRQDGRVPVTHPRNSWQPHLTNPGIVLLYNYYKDKHGVRLKKKNYKKVTGG